MTNYLDDEAAAARHDADTDREYVSAADVLDPSEWPGVQRAWIAGRWEA